MKMVSTVRRKVGQEAAATESEGKNSGRERELVRSDIGAKRNRNSVASADEIDSYTNG